MPNFATNGEAFPVLFMAPVSTEFGEFADKYTVNFYCYAPIQKDRSDVNNVHSDTQLILNDLKKFIKNSPNTLFGIEADGSSIPMREITMDYVIGNTMTVTIDVDTYGICDIPFADLPLYPVSGCDIIYAQYLTCETVVECNNLDVFIHDIVATASTRVQPGTNINTGGTANFPIVNLDADIVLTSVNAASISGDTLYSGSTDVSDLFVSSLSGVTGYGTINNIPLWDGSQSLTDSIITQNGTSGITLSGNLSVTDNDFILNYGGTNASASGGGIIIEDGVSNGSNSSWLIDTVGNWHTNQSVGVGVTASTDNALTIRAKTNNSLNNSFTIRNSVNTNNIFKIDDLGNLFINNSNSFNGRFNCEFNGTTIGQLFATSSTHMVYGGGFSVRHVFRNNGSIDYINIYPAAGTFTSKLVHVYENIKPFMFSGAGYKKMQLGGASSTDGFVIRNADDTSDLFKVQGNGTAVIGTPSGTTLLEVNGDTVIFGNLSASTLFSGSISGDTLYSGSTDVSDLFVSSLSGVTGYGTINNIPLWDGSQSLIDSIITQNGTSGITVSGNIKGTGELHVDIERWTIDLMTSLSTTIYASESLSITLVEDIVNSPTTVLTLSGSSYTLGDPIVSGDEIGIVVSTASVIKLKIEK